MGLLAQPHLCRADDTSSASASSPTGSHRGSLTGGYVPLSLVYSEFEGSEGRRDENPSTYFRAAYAYRVERGVELGAALTAAVTPYNSLLLPAATIRPYIPWSRVEIGLTARIGALAAMGPGDWGWALSGGPDVRIWATPSLGIHLGGGAGIGGASSRNPTHRFAYVPLASIELGIVVGD